MVLLEIFSDVQVKAWSVFILVKYRQSLRFSLEIAFAKLSLETWVLLCIFRKALRFPCIQETMNDIDKDGDGFISLEEYIGIYAPHIFLFQFILFEIFIQVIKNAHIC